MSLIEKLHDIRDKDHGLVKEDSERSAKPTAAKDIETGEADTETLSDIVVHERFVTGLGERR